MKKNLTVKPEWNLLVQIRAMNACAPGTMMYVICLD